MANLGIQGGDDRALPDAALDLSTCVNPYGPPGSARAALLGLTAAAIRRHPYGAARALAAAYADSTGTDISDFTAGTGTSDFIWLLAQVYADARVGLPLPSYTEFLQAFPRARTFGGGPMTHPPEVLDAALADSDFVLISNPHNPTGQVIPAAELAAACGRHPGALLAVDESYIDFLPEARQRGVTLIGADVPNVAVLRSPSKFYGLAGLRAGVLWSRGPLRKRIEERRSNWPVSAPAAAAVPVALRDARWAHQARLRLGDDVRWLDCALRTADLPPVPGELHFRLVTGDNRQLSGFTEILRAHRIRVRSLTEAHGAGSPAIRVSAPARAGRAAFAAALSDLPARSGGAA